MSFNCSATALSGEDSVLCDYIAANVAPILYTPDSCAYNQYFVSATDGCGNYTSPLAKASALEGVPGTLDPGNTAWVLFATALVMIMTPGVGLFYAGLAGEESAGNTILMSFTTMCVVTIQWFLFGYAFAFGPGSNAFGDGSWAVMRGVGLAPSACYGFGIPHILFAAFQCMFAQITPALISGAVIGRMKFTSYIIFVLIWTTVIYDALAHWVWSFGVKEDYSVGTLGWLGTLGSLDFAGGTVIHVSSGYAALAAAIVLGPRRAANEPMKPHNVPMVVIGATFLWFGWFGFNAGSALSAAGNTSQAFWNTHLATATGSIAWMACEFFVDKRITAVGACAGAVAGLIGITPACGFVWSYAAFLIGLITAPISYFAAKLKAKYGPDDTLDAWALHGVSGGVGAALTGLFATSSVTPGYSGGFYGNQNQFAYQLAEICVAAGYSFVGTIVILLLLKYTIGIRVSEDAEAAGLDVSEHGGASYNKETSKAITSA